MEGSWLDSLPSRERQRLRKRLRSPEAYERLRERVKGPEDLEREMARSEKLAELSFAMETDAAVKESVHARLERDVREQGIEAVLESGKELPPHLRTQLEQGKFVVNVSSHPRTHEDALIVVPEGNVHEKLPVKVSFTDQYTSAFMKHSPS